MKLLVTKEAANWYKEEFDVQQPTSLRFYVRYGFGGIIPGYSLAITTDKMDDVYASCEVGDITFFIKEKDAWYFDDKNLTIEFNQEKQEPEFIYDE
ncbi:HesB/YadR/YfhF family protein [Virgibacillus byunsanensis]|uniref:HesB/YadR/YfhF family protein n=1 Tax=Virgibacillus byunsanensis TaxID=570945 RepID=A0ABW3LID5_9BACI